MCPRARRQTGFALVTAIFLLVVLAALGAFLVSISATQHAASALDVQGARAYQAARAGIEWGAYQVLNPENTNNSGTPPPAYTAQYACGGTPATPALGGTLSGFTVTVQCSYADNMDGARLVRTYQIISRATAGTPGGTDYVDRQLTATLATCRESLNGRGC
jgi:MSHA biogenesis protein MshP